MKVKAQCHCGAVELEAQLIADISTARRCNCSFCRMRQGANVSAATTSVTILKGHDMLRCYTFGTETAKHWFCSICGIYTHHQRRSDPDETGINIGCIKGINPFDYEPIGWSDGVNHPSDQ